MNVSINSDLLDDDLIPNHRVIMSLIHLLFAIIKFWTKFKKKYMKPLAKPHKLICLLHGYRYLFLHVHIN